MSFIAKSMAYVYPNLEDKLYHLGFSGSFQKPTFKYFKMNQTSNKEFIV